MILADKLIALRKKNGWSQEELAERLDVSRQAVSKWESAQSVPDMNRVLQLSELFGVTTDYLLKDELEECAPPAGPLPEEAGKPLRRVSLEEAQAFLACRAQNAARISLGVLLCVLSPVPLILFAAGQETGRLPLTEQQAAGLGLLPLFVLVGCAVALFVLSGLSGKRFEYLTRECFETEYGVSGFVREQRERTRGAFAARITVGVTLCVVSVIPIFIGMLLPGGEAEKTFALAAAAAALLCLVACGVWLIVRAAVSHGAYDVLLEEGEHSRENKRFTMSKTGRAVASCYWCLVTAGYLAYSFITMNWDRSWIVWPVAGVLYGVVLAVVGALPKKDG